MTSVKSMFLCIAAGVLLVSFGLFSQVLADHHVEKSASVVSPTSDSADPPAAQPSGDLQCGAETTRQPLSLEPSVEPRSCPKGTAHTCCPCGGCGCRPQNISPANWCAC
jgi:hypothetical protein